MNAKTFFGPLSRNYCDLFFYLAAINLVFFFLVLISGVAMLAMKKVPLTYSLHMLWVLVIYGVFYLQNRLLYNMCSGQVV